MSKRFTFLSFILAKNIITQHPLHSFLLGIVCASALSVQANAAAFYIQEQSVSGMGTAFAGSVADTPDASTVFYNPAGMTELKKKEIYVGSNLIVPHAKFKNTGSTRTSTIVGGALSSTYGSNGDNPFDAAVVPNLYFTVPLIPDELWFGFGVSAPFGLANEYDRDFVGRYNSTESELSVIDFAPSLAYKVTPWLSLGGGIDVQKADAKLENAVPNPVPTLQTPDTDGYTDLSGDDVTVGFNAGVQVKPTEGTKIGLHYREGISHTLEGRVITVLPTSLPGGLAGFSGAALRSSGTAELDLPDIASLGVSQKIGGRWTVLGSVNYYKWSNFDDIPIQTGPNNLSGAAFRSVEQNYQNTWGGALGLRYQVNDRLQLKAGFQYDQTPTVDEFRSTRIPDGDRKWYAAGMSYAFNDRISLDLSGMYVDLSKEKIDITDQTTLGAVTSTNRTRGETGGSVGIVSTAIRVNF